MGVKTGTKRYLSEKTREDQEVGIPSPKKAKLPREYVDYTLDSVFHEAKVKKYGRKMSDTQIKDIARLFRAISINSRSMRRQYPLANLLSCNLSFENVLLEHSRQSIGEDSFNESTGMLV